MFFSSYLFCGKSRMTGNRHVQFYEKVDTYSTFNHGEFKI